MLTELRIRNFAIIESVTLPLQGRFNVLTGETGAGKSIVVGALGLLLGERASVDLIRPGAERATVEGVFEFGDRDDLAAVLDSHGIDVTEGTLILRREVSISGRTRAWINDATSTAGMLAQVGRQLVNLHGQHEAQALLDEESQRRILDEFGECSALAVQLRRAHDAVTEIQGRIRTLESRRVEAERRADYLRHVAREVGDANLVIGEQERLEEDARRLEHADELRTLASGITDAVDGDDDALLQRIGGIQRSLASIQRIDPSLARLQEMLDAGYFAFEELARELGAYSSAIDLDPARLAEVQSRRDLLFRLAKKYGPSMEEIVETGQRARSELDLLETAEFDLAALREEHTSAAATLAGLAQDLTKRRRKAAMDLGRAVDAVLPALGMTDGRFMVELIPRGEPGPAGAETVEFRVTLNVGHDARPLARVASGGELSRVMLALKTVLARLDHVPTLVFDEVDSGIGGRVALQVGDTMRGVAAHHQVLAITHLPQIAARAHHHIVVTKGARDGFTTADIAVVGGDARIEEIARMLGGDPESDVSRAHAAELLESSASPPPKSASSRRRAISTSEHRA
ncbi:MAG: DNA repair protein RecN [Gemmatimonadaceae bacterium]